MSPLSMILSGFSLRYDRWVCGFLIRLSMFSEWKSSLVDVYYRITTLRSSPTNKFLCQRTRHRAAVVRHKPEPVGPVL